MKVKIIPNPGMHPHHARAMLDRCGVPMVLEQHGEYICEMNQQQRDLWTRNGFAHRLIELDPKPEPEPVAPQTADVNAIAKLQAQIDELSLRLEMLETCAALQSTPGGKHPVSISA